MLPEDQIEWCPSNDCSFAFGAAQHNIIAALLGIKYIVNTLLTTTPIEQLFAFCLPSSVHIS